MSPYDTSLLDKVLKEKMVKLKLERQKLLSVTKQVLFSLQKRYRIKEAYILGSLLEKNWHQSSDIDVAISGASEYLLEIMRELEKKTKREVDVIDLDNHPFPDIVRKRGKLVYG